MAFSARKILSDFRTESAFRAAVRAAQHALSRPANADRFPAIVARRVLGRLNRCGHLVQCPESSDADYLRVLILQMAWPENANGFTLAPVISRHGLLPSPREGHCVALPGTDLPIPTSTNPTLSVVQADARQVEEWIEYMEPILRTGYGWIGGFRSPTGEFEIEGTAVFHLTSHDQARQAAQVWKQHSYWTIDSSGGHLTQIGLTPCRSVLKSFLEFKNR